jgi:anaerobic magnesium-protoporphyrin IX monomethyl ester cyclase
VKIVLVHPPPRSEFDRHWARFPVLGLAYVAGSLLAAGHQVVLLDGKLAGLSVADIRRRVREEAPDLVGITCMTVEFPVAVEIARAIKADAAVPIVVGGAHVNAVGKDALVECEAFDFACVGEGEHLIGELAAALGDPRSFPAIPGLVFRRHGLVIANAARPYPRDYDALPFPAWHLFQLGDQVPLLTHRGCPFQCNFCGHNSGFRPRYRSVGNVLAEIEELARRYRPAVIRFEDETFGLQVGRTKELLSGILARGLHHRVRFSAQTRVDRIDREFVGLLRAARFETLELGVESGNPAILAATRKGITLDQVEAAVRLAREQKLLVWCKFILGHPHETVDTIRDTVDFIARINPDRLSVAIMTPFPGTPIHDMVRRGEGGYRLLAHGWQDFDKYSAGALELDTVSLGQLKRYQLWAYANLYLRNRRLGELARLVWDHRALAQEMAWSTVARSTRELVARRSA